MAINLGDVNFGVGADLSNLQRSVRNLEAFGRVVDRAQGSVDGLGRALARQENLAGQAFVKVQNLTSAMSRIRGSDQYITAANNAFARFNTTMTSGRLSALEMQRAQERLRVSLSNTQNQFKAFTAEARRAEMGSGGLIDKLRGLQAAAILTTGPLSGIAIRLSAFTSLTRTAGFSIAAFVAGGISMAAILAKIGMEANRAGAAMKGWQSGLTAVTGSQQEASKEIAFGIKTAEDAGTALGHTIGSWTKFAAAAEGTTLQGEKAQKTFSSFAKAATILNISADDTAGIFKALEQMISKGTVQAEELRGQLGDRLPGAFQLAARAMGVTTAKLGDMMKKGAVMTDEFLPKLEAELRRTFNIPTGPIDTYAAALGRMQTAYERLMIAIDQKFDITGKVQAAANAIASGLNWVRENLDEVVAKIAVFGSALAAVFVPPVGIPLLIGAIQKFGDQFQVIAGEAGTLKDYMNLIWQDIVQGATSAGSGISAELQKGINNFITNIPQLEKDMATIWEGLVTGVEYAQKGIDASINGIANSVMAAFEAMSAAWPMLPSAIASGVVEAMNFMIRQVNRGLAVVADGINSVISGINAVATTLGGTPIDFKVNLDINEIENKYAGAGAKAGEAFDKAWSDRANNPVDYAKKLNSAYTDGQKAMSDYADSVRKRANAEATVRNYVNDQVNQVKESTRISGEKNAALERQKRLEETLAKFGNDGGGGGSGKKGGKGAAKALERRAQAIKDIEEAISRANEEIEAMGGTEGDLKRLNEEFKRRDEVEKYAKALRKAGVDTDYIKTKTEELYNLLKQRDDMKLMQQGMSQWSDQLSKSVDFIGESLTDIAFEGKDAFKNIGQAARSLAKDLVKTFVELSLTNPLKNLIFGQNNPMMQGGAGGGMFDIFGKIFGSLFGGGAAADPWAGLRLRNGGVLEGLTPIKKARNGLVSKPTNFMTSMGPVQAGEAGTEAIMPLERDSSGSLGVRASVPMSGNVYVNVTAPEGSKVSKKQSSNSKGDQFIDIIIEQAKQAVAGDIVSGGTGINKALEGRYGLAASKGIK